MSVVCSEGNRGFTKNITWVRHDIETCLRLCQYSFLTILVSSSFIPPSDESSAPNTMVFSPDGFDAGAGAGFIIACPALPAGCPSTGAGAPLIPLTIELFRVFLDAW